MISKRTHPEGSDAARDNTLRMTGDKTGLDARTERPSRAGAPMRDRDAAAGDDAGTPYVVPNAIERDDDV
jgi:hypothetical protein